MRNAHSLILPAENHPDLGEALKEYEMSTTTDHAARAARTDYEVSGTLFRSRWDAITALAEAFLGPIDGEDLLREPHTGEDVLREGLEQGYDIPEWASEGEVASEIDEIIAKRIAAAR